MKVTTTKTKECRYEGELEMMPWWAKGVVMPWYRRILIAPTTLYFVIGVGMLIRTDLYSWMRIPSYILMAHICGRFYWEIMRREALKKHKDE